MHDVSIVAHTAVAVIGAIVLIVGVRLSPVIALEVGAIYLGLAAGLGVEGTISAITEGFGSILAEVGLLIAFGVLTGAMLHRAKAIERLVSTLLRVCGARGMPYATALTTGTVLQSIFTDVLVVVSAPLVRQVAPQIGERGLPRMASALAIGSVTGVVFVVPGAAGVAIAGVLHVPLGQMLVAGLVLAVPTLLISMWIMSVLFKRGWWDPAKDEQPEAVVAAAEQPEERSAWTHEGSEPDAPSSAGGVSASSARHSLETLPNAGTRELPLVVLFSPLVLGLVLIATGGILDIAGVEQPVLKFLSSPVIALLIGLVGTTVVVSIGHGRKLVETALTDGFRESGQILVLTGVAGSLAATISRAGLGDIVGQYFSASSAAPLLMVWVMAAVLHVTIGTVTIAAITSVGVLAPVAAAIGIDPVLIALAAGSGSIFAVHLTSNTFWQFQSLFGQSVRGTLKTYTGGVSVASIVSILLLMLMSLVYS